MAGSAAGVHPLAVLDSAFATCRQLGIDPFTYLRSTLPGLSAMGEEPADADLTAGLLDTWLARRPAPTPPITG